MRRNRVDVFSLSFLDVIACGLGAVILLFVLVNAKNAARQDAVTADLRAEVERFETRVLAGKKRLVDLRATVEATRAEWVQTRGLSQKLVEIMEAQKNELADRHEETLAATAHVNQLKADLKSLEEEVKHLRAGAKTRDAPGARLRPFPGHGDRQHLTDLKMGGRHIFILVDASASMLDETIVGVIRRRNLEDSQKIKSPKWQQAVKTIDWLTTQLPGSGKFQIYGFNEVAFPLNPETRGTWLDAGDVDALNATADAMHRLVPASGTSLLNAFNAMAEMKPAPDNIFLLTDSLPTMGEGKPWGKRVSSQKRLSLFREATRNLPAGAPVNVILYPMEGDPLAADAYWRLAKNTRGSFFCPAKDWP